MVRSMTGFGRAEVLTEQYRVSCEVKSVNHRYFEFSARAPRSCGFLEERLKRFFQERVSRGKIECYVSVEFLGDSGIDVKLNTALLAGYLEAFKQAKEAAGALDCDVDSELEFGDLLRIQDLFQTSKRAVDEDEVWAVAAQAAGEACEKFIAMRETEGARLQEDVLFRSEEVLRHVAFIEERSPQTALAYNEKLLGRMRELLENASVDEQRLLTEAAIFADKIAVAEETVRLRSHLQQLEAFFADPGEAVGRKMDFLVQEINREANTIGSKASDIEIARRVVEIKSNVEKIREQVQNIE